MVVVVEEKGEHVEAALLHRRPVRSFKNTSLSAHNPSECYGI